MKTEIKPGVKVVATNRKAFHDYFIVTTWEAGLVLKGTEIKSIRQSKVSLKESFAKWENGEIFVYSMHISPYEQGNRFNVDPLRVRKLLLHRHEIRKIYTKVAERGMTLVPLKVYLERNHAKVELALVKGKKDYDRRQAIADRDAERQQRIEEKDLRRGER